MQRCSALLRLIYYQPYSRSGLAEVVQEVMSEDNDWEAAGLGKTGEAYKLNLMMV